MNHDWIVCVKGSKSPRVLNFRFNDIPVSYAPRPFPTLIYPIAGLLIPRADPYLLCLTALALSRGFDFFLQPIKRL